MPTVTLQTAPAPADTERRGARRPACLAVVLALVSACTTPPQLGAAAPLPLPSATLPPHRHVEEVTIDVRGRPEFDLVAHVAVSDEGVRAHLGSEDGLTGLDVEVRGGATTVHAESSVAPVPNLAALVALDLRRVWGDLGPLRADRSTGRAVLGEPGLVAVRVGEGGWALLRRTSAGSVEAILTDTGFRERAAVSYSDFDEHDVPRSVVLRDAGDGHVLSIEVVEIRVTRSPR